MHKFLITLARRVLPAEILEALNRPATDDEIRHFQRALVDIRATN